MGTSFDLDDLGGYASLDERGTQDEKGYWGKTELIDRDADVSLDVAVDSDDDGRWLALKLSTFHIENEETKRVFHFHLKAYLNRAQAERLIGYLEYVIKHEM